MSDVVYRSEVRVERVEGAAARRAPPGRDEAGDVRRARRDCRALRSRARHATTPHATTIDYVVAATAG